MSNVTKQDLLEQLDDAEEVVDEAAAVLADDDLSSEEKLEALENVIFRDDD